MELEMLKTIIEKTLGRNMDAITEKTTFVDDLGVDSLDFFQILKQIFGLDGTLYCLPGIFLLLALGITC